MPKELRYASSLNFIEKIIAKRVDEGRLSTDIEKIKVLLKDNDFLRKELACDWIFASDESRMSLTIYFNTNVPTNNSTVNDYEHKFVFELPRDSQTNDEVFNEIASRIIHIAKVAYVKLDTYALDKYKPLKGK